MRFLQIFSLTSLLLVAACSATGSTGFDEDDAGTKKDGGGTGPVIGGNSDASVDAKPPTETALYANTDTELFSLNSAAPNVAPKSLGKFDCIGKGDAVAMTDIGVGKDGKLYGVSQVAAYPLSIGTDGTVHCEETWPLPANSRFYGLTMAPENTVNAQETLIGANQAGELYSIDAQTGKTTKVGTFGKDNKNNPYQLSGDIVILANGGSPVGFATVRTCPNNKCQDFDTLIELDVAAIKPGAGSVLKSVRGALNLATSCKKAGIPTQFGSVYGVAAYGDKVYGFTRDGYSIEISNANGDTCMIGSSSSMKFAGAGVTTIASIIAPK